MVVEEIDTAQPSPAVDRGMLRGSVEPMDVPDGTVVSVGAPHAAIMEHGTRPFWPPAEPLIEWAIRKGLADDRDEAEEIVFGIQRAIATSGIEPRNYFSKAFERVLPVIMQEVEHELEGL
jgi:hypothetical protein